MAGRQALRRLQVEDTGPNLQGIRAYAGSVEGQVVKSNGSYTAVIWDSQPSAVAVFPAQETGSVGPTRPLIRGHTGPVLDFDFNPFNDLQLLTASEDCTLKLWEYPENALSQDLSMPLVTLQGHKKKVTTVAFNPSAAFISASASQDNTLKVWALERAAELYSLQPTTTDCHCLQWNSTGSLLASSWKDQLIRLIDPRTSTTAVQYQAHDGAKRVKMAWLAQGLVTCGFSKNGDRKVAIWDLRNVEKPVGFDFVRSGTGVLYPFAEADLPFLFVSGKGDRSFSLFQLSDTAPGLQLLETCSCPGSVKSFSLLPRRRLSPGSGEVQRVLRLIDENLSQMAVKPKRNEAAEDLYPPCIGLIPAFRAAQWAEGGSGEPERVTLREAASLPRRGIAYTALEALVSREILRMEPLQPPTGLPTRVNTEEVTELRKKLEEVTEENKRLHEVLDTYDRLLFGCSAADYATSLK